MSYTEQQLKIEHAYRYNERLGIMEVWGVPTQDQHNLAVAEANETVAKLRKENGLIARLKAFREAL